MALVKCRECGKEISNKAAACPGCGVPTSTKAVSAPEKVDVVRSGAAWERLGFVVIIVGLLMCIFGTGHTLQVGAIAMAAGFVIFVIGRLK